MSQRAGVVKVLDAILKEREFQDQKYGTVLDHRPVHPNSPAGEWITEQGKGGHELGAWLVIAESELEEAKKALVHGGSKTGKGRDTIRAELVQLAAVCVAALEQWGVEE